MPSYRDQGLVLRHYNLGEADLIVVLFTRGHGVVRCVAKGVRRSRSRFGARLEPFTLSDVQIYPGRNLSTITEAVTVETFNARIVADYGRYTAAAAILEATERLLGEEQPNQRLFDLTVGVLGALAEGQRAPQQMVDTYLLRAMAEAGWAPELEEMRRLRRRRIAPSFPPCGRGSGLCPASSPRQCDPHVRGARLPTGVTGCAVGAS